jgi:mannitol/fructose-specific phosphotransferase system IIA component (Ntr-type)
MDLMSILGDAIVLDMGAADKLGAIQELVAAVINKKGIAAADEQAVVDAVMERESRGSTGLGDGIAVPHVRDSGLVSGLTGAFGRSSTGIPFDAVDGNPVNLVFLILGGEGTSEDHTQVLRILATLRQNEHFLRFLEDASDVEGIVEIIKEMAGSAA